MISPITQNELNSRIGRLQAAIAQQQADACIITSSVNMLYLAGFIFDGFLFVTPDNNPVLFVKRPIDIVGDRTEIIRKPEQIPDLLPKYGIELPKNVLLETDVLSYNSTMRLQAALGMPNIGNASGTMRRLRSVKSDYELQLIRRSAKIQNEVYSQIPEVFRRGMTDIEFQIEMERRLRMAGSAGIFRSFGENMDIFMGSVLAGDNAATASPYDFALGGKGISPTLPLGASGTALAEGTTLMVDMSGCFTPYQSDTTRSFAIGKVADIAHKAHQVSIDIHQAIINEAKAGVACAELYGIAARMVKEQSLEPYFMGTVQQAKFIGHGVGLEINEPPVLTPNTKDVLLSGMTIAVEPKFVLPGIGAVGIENTYIVNDSSIEKITLCDESLIEL